MDHQEHIMPIILLNLQLQLKFLGYNDAYIHVKAIMTVPNTTSTAASAN